MKTNIIIASILSIFFVATANAGEVCGTVKSVSLMPKSTQDWKIELEQGQSVIAHYGLGISPLIAASLSNNIVVCFNDGLLISASK